MKKISLVYAMLVLCVFLLMMPVYAAIFYTAVNPDYGYDTTDTPYTLLADPDLLALTASDDIRYTTVSAWYWKYVDTEYLEFTRARNH